MTEQKQLDQALEYYAGQRMGQSPLDQTSTIALLREIQDIFGYIPGYTLEQVCQTTGYKLPLLQKLIRLYPSLKTSKAAHEIVVCSGGRCGNAGAGELLRQLEEGLKQLPQDTAILRTQMCFKQCGKGPNIQLDGQMYNGCDSQTVKEMLEQLKRKVGE
ncbi:MAG: NAD(P)H-dependent oxidoreductase subunit E [Candidatus Fournierella pullistercoris]|uniref:NAD(P)H-dependent oxidoreductase subunit E n=1 Tax=Candidatus Allofournierella pullistercoris TaxID=2838597 RepID=A0A948T1M9_9FIRM|nr:NAD(P)H-dependent oxidoreductase subunit E [Candidatus Fournierella pullistercoris]